MALKAGYYGLKNSIIAILEKLASDMSGAVIVKSVGDGLDISEEGELSAEIKSIGDGLSLSEEGELSAEIKSVGDGLSLSENGVLSSDGLLLTSAEKKVGKLGLADLYEKTFTFKSTDLQDSTISASVIKGSFILDVPAFDRIWIDFGNSYYFNGAASPAPKALSLNYYAGDGTKYTRANIQQRSSSYDGKPYVYFDSNYAESVYDNISDLEWVFTVKYTKSV